MAHRIGQAGALAAESRNSSGLTGASGGWGDTDSSDNDAETGKEQEQEKAKEPGLEPAPLMVESPPSSPQPPSRTLESARPSPPPPPPSAVPGTSIHAMLSPEVPQGLRASMVGTQIRKRSMPGSFGGEEEEHEDLYEEGEVDGKVADSTVSSEGEGLGLAARMKRLVVG